LPYAEGYTPGAIEVEWALDASPGSKASARSHTPSAWKPGDLDEASSRTSERQPRKGRRRNPRHHVEESDALVVPKKSANSRVTPEESMEGRSAAKGKLASRNARRTQGRESAPTHLKRVGIRITKDKETRFSNLFCHLKVSLLRSAFHALRKHAATGIDEVDWVSYAGNLEEHLAALQDRLHRGSYHPLPVRRVYIPKADGRMRPLGVPALEDKIVQQAVRMILEPIYEQHFVGFSYGFRPDRSAHDALDAVAVAITRKRTNWILDADIKSFFDTLHHGWMKKFLEHRIADRRLVHLIVKWLNAGVWEAGHVQATQEGTPQGGIISPLLSNIYLHYVLDLWAQQWRNRKAMQAVYVVRYADDFVMGFEDGRDARRMKADLARRLEQFGLALHDEKTRVLSFGRYARERLAKDGRKPETFDFLGFTHIASQDKRGWFLLRRFTAKKKRTAKYAELKTELRTRRHAPINETHQWLNRVLRGHYNDYGVPGNERALGRFRCQLRSAWYRQLRRRSQRATWTVSKTKRFERRYPLLRPKIMHPWPEERL
jgi:group II intron reverse transcriptase/maturase